MPKLVFRDGAELNVSDELFAKFKGLKVDKKVDCRKEIFIFLLLYIDNFTDKEFVSKLEPDTFLEVLVASEKYGPLDLADVCAAFVTQKLQSGTNFLNIENDFTEDEQKAMQVERDWINSTK